MRILDVNLKENSYKIYISKNIIFKIGDFIKNNFKFTRIAVITDTNVMEYYGEILNNSLKEQGYEVCFITIEPGEKSKSLKVLEEVYRGLSDFKIGRKDLIITFGGGVVGDLGGFAASTYLRGIPYIGVPTSLLSQVDSSIGGKVAIDLPWGKNLAGSFYQPKAVFIDPKLLVTLSKKFLHDGLAEVIKYGCIKDESIITELIKFENDEELLEHIDDIIYKCCNIKSVIVEKDEKDFGERMLLNFGHTLGHAIEKHGNYEDYTHGEAVGIGMLDITRRSEELGITEKGSAKLIRELLLKFELPVHISQMSKDEAINIIELDKKRIGKEMNLILLRKIGEAFINRIDTKDLILYFN